MVRSIEVFLKEAIIEDADEAWERSYFARFRVSPRGDPGDPPAPPRAFLAELAEANADLYRRQEISPKTYSYLIFIWKVLDLCADPAHYDPHLFDYQWAFPLQASLSAEEQAESRAAWEADLRAATTGPGGPESDRARAAPAAGAGDGDGRPGLEKIPTLLMRGLLRHGTIGIVRDLIKFLYYSYEHNLDKLFSSSVDRATWLGNIADIIPYLLVRNFIPVHDVVVVRDPRIVLASEGAPGGASGLCDPGTVSRVSGFFRNVFTAEEIQSLELAGQRIAETFAHLYPIVLVDVEEFLADRKTEILEMAKEKGKFGALQDALIFYKNKLCIPRYTYEEVRLLLRPTTAPVGDVG